jgi:hypothetical protein
MVENSAGNKSARLSNQATTKDINPWAHAEARRVLVRLVKGEPNFGARRFQKKNFGAPTEVSFVIPHLYRSQNLLKKYRTKARKKRTALL